MSEIAESMSTRRADGAKAAGETPALFQSREMARFGQQGLDLMTRATRAYWNGATEMNKEIADFIGRRVRKDVETSRAFMTSANGGEAFRTQADFVEEMIRDYAEETSRLFALAADTAREALRPVEELPARRSGSTAQTERPT
jgi:hypothetical protein